ncbi:MAG: C1 family peptidase, partial [Candidatus Krumholzibacteria bacterium]|nr:C1 family peptidase [Candidatus Krumholzibacteria bacterium]
MRSRLLLALLVVTVAALWTADAFAQAPVAAPKKYQVFPDEPTEFGYVEPPHDLSHIKPIRDLLMAPAASWDWRTMNGVTSVKNQGIYGTCWAFAACGDLESKVLIDEMTAYDYSELNIQACNPTSTNCNSGGNAWMSTNYLSLLGTVDEACNPYPGGCPTPTCVNPACAFGKQVTGWKMIPNDVASIKAAVQSYGPVYTSMYASFPGFGAYDGSYCLTYTGTEDPNHGVLIVGFDDDMCGGNGAWIVKNSWGTSWGDNGYFYIQYGHARVGTSANVITGYRTYDSGMSVHHWDEWGWWSSVGFGDGRDYAVVEIVPQAGEQFLYSVHFWATSGPTTYTIQVFDNFNGSSMPTTSLAGPWTATVNEAGYYTIDLATPVAVTAGNPIYVYADLNTGTYAYPVPYDDTGPMETNRSFISNTGSTYSALDNGNYAMGDIGLRATLGPEIVAGECSKEGDPAFYVAFPSDVQYVIRGELWEYEIAPTNFGFVSATCPGTDTFCVDVSDLLGWAVTGDPAFNTAHVLDAGYLWWQMVAVQVPCEATVGATNTVTAVMAYTDMAGVCAPDCGDCEDPNMYGGTPRYSTTTVDFEVVASPPSLYILQDSLYFVEQGQTAAYVPFSICNGDACAPPTLYNYVITSTGVVGPAINQTGQVTVDGGACLDI